MSFTKSKQTKTGQHPHICFLPSLSLPLLVSVSCGHTMGKVWAEHVCLSGVAASLQCNMGVSHTGSHPPYPLLPCATSSSTVLAAAHRGVKTELTKSEDPVDGNPQHWVCCEATRSQHRKVWPQILLPSVSAGQRSIATSLISRYCRSTPRIKNYYLFFKSIFGGVASLTFLGIIVKNPRCFPFKSLTRNLEVWCCTQAGLKV